LQNLFYLDRFLLSRDQQQGGHLVEVSFEILSMIVTLWTYKDRFSNIVGGDFAWLVSIFHSNTRERVLTDR
jgi:hypothetical protein